MTTTTDARVLDLPLDHVHAAPDNVRSDLGPDDELDQLTASIAEVGVLQPIDVIVHPELGVGDYLVVFGHRRRAASIRAGKTKIPGIVREYQPAQVLVARLIENLHRADLAPLDEARAYLKLKQDHGLAQAEIAQRVGRSEAHVSKRLSLLLLPEPIQDAVDRGRITVTTALGATALAKDQDAMAAVVATVTETDELGIDELNAVVAASVHHQLQLRERAARRQELVDKWEAKGVTILDNPSVAYRHTRAGEKPTHVYVSPHGTVEKYVKADPPAQKKVTSKKQTAAARAAEEAREELLAQRDQAAERREAIYRQILDDQGAYLRSLDWLTRWLAIPGAAEFTDAGAICRLLNLPESNRHWEAQEHALFTYSRRGRDQACAVAVARMLVTIEELLGPELDDPETVTPLDGRDWAFRAQIELLYSILDLYHYEPTAFERVLLDEPKATK